LPEGLVDNALHYQQGARKAGKSFAVSAVEPAGKRLTNRSNPFYFFSNPF
jgi:hypothetical protein